MSFIAIISSTELEGETACQPFVEVGHKLPYDRYRIDDTTLFNERKHDARGEIAIVCCICATQEIRPLDSDGIVETSLVPP